MPDESPDKDLQGQVQKESNVQNAQDTEYLQEFYIQKPHASSETNKKLERLERATFRSKIASWGIYITLAVSILVLILSTSLNILIIGFLPLVLAEFIKLLVVIEKTAAEWDSQNIISGQYQLFSNGWLKTIYTFYTIRLLTNAAPFLLAGFSALAIAAEKVMHIGGFLSGGFFASIAVVAPVAQIIFPLALGLSAIGAIIEAIEKWYDKSVDYAFRSPEEVKPEKINSIINAIFMTSVAVFVGLAIFTVLTGPVGWGIALGLMIINFLVKYGINKYYSTNNVESIEQKEPIIPKRCGIKSNNSISSDDSSNRLISSALTN